MNIEFIGPNSPQEWFHSFSSKIEGEIQDKTLIIPPSLGEGFVKQLTFFDEMTITYFYTNLLEPLRIKRKSSKSSNLIPIFFYNFNNIVNQKVQNSSKVTGYHTENGIFMSSSQLGTDWEIPAKMDEYQLTITVTKDWLLSNLSKEKSLTYEIITGNNLFYIFETLSENMLVLISEIHNEISGDSSFKKLLLHQKTVELMTLFIEKIEQRQGDTHIYNINQIDLNNIFSVRKQISSSFPDKLKIDKLARDNGISVRKLQNLFKQIFGITISQFMLNDRMRKAKEMLDSGTYTVSEVGYFLGYTNLSHFTQAFKKKFQVNPKKYSQEAQMIIHNRDIN